MSIYQAVAELEARNGGGVLCTIVRSQGSTPRHTASKMLVYPDGRIIGSVGGGELENRVIAEAQRALEDGKARILQYAMADPARGDPGVCGGQVEVYVEPILPKTDPGGDRSGSCGQGGGAPGALAGILCDCIR